MNRATLITLLILAVVVVARKEVKSQVSAPVLSSAEITHARPFFRLGDGFEGTASDWTEYVVWVIGVIGVLCYMGNPNMRRNLYAMEGDTPLNRRRQEDEGLSDDDSDTPDCPTPSGQIGRTKQE